MFVTWDLKLGTLSSQGSWNNDIFINKKLKYLKTEYDRTNCCIPLPDEAPSPHNVLPKEASSSTKVKHGDALS